MVDLALRMSARIGHPSAKAALHKQLANNPPPPGKESDRAIGRRLDSSRGGCAASRHLPSACCTLGTCSISVVTPIFYAAQKSIVEASVQ